MAAFESRIVVVTKDTQFYSKIRQSLSRDALVTIMINVSSVLDADNKFLEDKPNVLIIDTDSGAIGTAAQIENLTKKYMLLVIFTGINQIKAAAYQSPNAREFIVKPVTSADNFTNSVLLRMRPFVMRQDIRHGASLTVFRDINSLAGSDTKVVFIASSTGGTEALERVFKDMPANCPPILVVQHMPSGFTRLFAERLNNYYPMNIKEAQTNDYVKSGQVLIAPADQHMAVAKQGDKFAVKCFIGEKVHAVMPAADVLFESAGPLFKNNAVGVVLTGMGSDGAKGLLQMHMLGAKTICQDEATSVVYGMPKAAFEMGAADYKLPLGEIGHKILQLAR